MAGGKNLGVRLKNKYFEASKVNDEETKYKFKSPQIYVPNFVIDWAEKRMKDLTKEAEAIIKKLRGGFGSFGEISAKNKERFCYGDINDFINKANHYIEENPEEKNKIRKMIKNIEKEVIDLKACNIISGDIDFRQVGDEGYKLYNSCNKEYETILKKIKDFKKQYKKTKMYVRSNDTFTKNRNEIREAYKTNIENFEKRLKCEEAFFGFKSNETINEKIIKKFEDKRDIVIKKITTTSNSNDNNKNATQFDPFQAINDPEINKKATYSEKIELFLKNILTQIITKYKFLVKTKSEKLDTDAKDMIKAKKNYAKDAMNLLSEIESFYGELCKFLNDNKSFVKELNKQDIKYKSIYDYFRLIGKMKLDIDKTFTEYVYKNSFKGEGFSDPNYAKELTDIKFYLQDCEKLIDDFYKKVGNPRTKFKDLKKAIKDLYDKYKGLDTITNPTIDKIVKNGSWNEKKDVREVEEELESKLNNIQICCKKIKDFSKVLQEMKKKFDDSQKPHKKALRFALNVFQKISRFTFISYKVCSFASGNIGDLKDIVGFFDAMTSDYLSENLK